MRILFLGHSHLQAFRKAPVVGLDDHVTFVQLFSEDAEAEAKNALHSSEFGAVCLSLHGNAHNWAGLVHWPLWGDQALDRFAPSLNAPLREWRNRRRLLPVTRVHFKQMEQWIARTRGLEVRVVIPPPPVPEDIVLENPRGFADMIARRGMAPLADRVASWRRFRHMLIRFAATERVGVLDVPTEAIASDGALKAEFSNHDPTHGNGAYGALALKDLFADLGLAPPREIAETNAKRDHPYRDLPARNWWSRAVARVPAEEIDPVGPVKFKIARSDLVVTAGSCFAQHIGTRFQADGFRFHVTEPVPEAERGKSPLFSARYGNIYTAAQWLQMIDRAYGRFEPVDTVWEEAPGKFLDPYRPTLIRDGFTSREALETARETHFAAIRRAVEEADVFVFTLGLTEAWLNREDGAVYPIVPGGAGGCFDPARHVFRNFAPGEVARDLTAALARIRDVNPGMRALITVSPVPLIATRAPRHVLTSTTYSKSVLRVAAETVCRADPLCDYFPSYEIITGAPSRGRYFGPDLREVTAEGVDHVMRVLYRNYTDHRAEDRTEQRLPDAVPSARSHLEEMARIDRVVCEEEILGRFDR